MGTSRHEVTRETRRQTWKDIGKLITVNPNIKGTFYTLDIEQFGSLIKENQYVSKEFYSLAV